MTGCHVYPYLDELHVCSLKDILKPPAVSKPTQFKMTQFVCSNRILFSAAKEKAKGALDWIWVHYTQLTSNLFQWFQVLDGAVWDQHECASLLYQYLKKGYMSLHPNYRPRSPGAVLLLRVHGHLEGVHVFTIKLQAQESRCCSASQGLWTLDWWLVLLRRTCWDDAQEVCFVPGTEGLHARQDKGNDHFQLSYAKCRPA